MALITGISPAIFFLIIFLIILTAAAIKILREYGRGVIFRLGRLIGAKGPGSTYSKHSYERRRRNNLSYILRNLLGNVLPVSKAFTLLSA